MKTGYSLQILHLVQGDTDFEYSSLPKVPDLFFNVIEDATAKSIRRLIYILCLDNFF